jgi:hypothetical protein
MDPGRARGGDRPDRARPQLGVLADQGAIEVGRECLDSGREVSREDQPCVAWTT